MLHIDQVVDRLAREKLQGLAPVVPVEPEAAPKAKSEVIGSEVIARRRWWACWLRGWYPDARMSIVAAAPGVGVPGSDRT
ncbi:hypothetical protein Rhow_001223 [Rhodococcus wratislaviensis]|uniref:Uncharacterized protein n=1 Tax=Rhodococcus wratislaviensis TaxID=44752 RepID=A0A402C3G9_RHOWR|nr:hypothetical protein [Rhodococcus wratislaviensis]GCE38184.1 hypothetical protein Rhow_001223 [Rhodococcus wratislaviensis]